MTGESTRQPISTPPTMGGPSNGVEPAGHPLRQLFSGAGFGIRPGEGQTAWLFFAYFFLLATVHYIGKSVRDSYYVGILGPTKLPYAYLLVAVLSLPILVLYARSTSRFSQRFLIAAVALIQAAGLVVFYWLFMSDIPQKGVALGFYIWTAVAFGIGVSQFWSYATDCFDPRQARRLFAFIGAGGLLGAIPGGIIASYMGSPKTKFVSEDALLVGALLSVGIASIAAVLGRRRPVPKRPDRGQATLDRLQRARGGLQAMRGSRLLMLIAALVFVATAANQLVDVQFKMIVHAWATGTDQLGRMTEVFGIFYAIMGLLSFLFQIFFTQRIHRALGVAFGLRVLPVSIAAASGLLLFALGGPLAIYAALALKLSETGFRHSVEQSSRELLFLPVPSALRLQAKAFIDVFVQRFAKGVTAITLLPIALLALSDHLVLTLLAWSVVAVVFVWLWVTVVARREYVRSFRDGLREGVIDEMPVVDAGDVNTVTTLVEAMGSSDARQVLHSLELLSASGQGRLVPPLLLHHDDPKVRRKVLGVLADEERTDAIPLVEQRIGDIDLEVRTAAMHALAALKGGDAAEFMLPRLEDPDPRIRAAAVASLARMEDPDLADRAEEVLNHMISDDDPSVRLEAARAVAEICEPAAAGSVIQLLYDEDRTVVQQAIVAVRVRMERDEPNPLYVPILISLMGSRRLKHRVREAIVAYGESAISALVHFMNSEEEQIWVRRNVPMAIAQIDSPAATTSLVDGLNASDPLIRQKVIEALAFLRVRHPEIRIRGDVVGPQIKQDVRQYLRCLADLWAISSWHETRFDGPYAHWQSSGRVPTLLQQVLAQKMVTAVDNVFGLLKLIHPARHVEATYRSLASGQQALRANALEYLDNSLVGGIRRDVFAVIDDTPIEEKLRKAAQLFDIKVETPETTLGRLLEPDPESDPGGVVSFAAIHAVFTEKITEYYEAVRTIAQHADNPILQETSEWVVNRLGLDRDEESDALSVHDGEGAAPMKKMALIEKVVLLQSIDLFATCNAEQVLQLASIANEIRFQSDALIYQRNDPPDGLFCLVEGRVSLTAPDEEPHDVVTGETFGVIDILRGQLRSHQAAATTESHALLIEADDFFDLLAINIEIVRALFRQLTKNALDAPAGLH